VHCLSLQLDITTEHYKIRYIVIYCNSYPILSFPPPQYNFSNPTQLTPTTSIFLLLVFLLLVVAIISVESAWLTDTIALTDYSFVLLTGTDTDLYTGLYKTFTWRNIHVLTFFGTTHLHS
jgi:hypothetical protein